MLKRLDFTPGINREVTSYTAEGAYYDCDKVRFRFGKPQKIGGWTDYSVGGCVIPGVCRYINTFSYLNATNLTMLGTHLKYFVEYGGATFDLTPVVASSSLTGTAFTTDTSTPFLLKVNDPLSVATEGSFVIISGVTGPINGIPDDEINKEHRVVEADAGYFVVEVETGATSSGTTGDANVDYLLAPGLPTYSTGNGWGAGAWSRGAWGSAADVGAAQQMRLWSTGNYGQAVIFNPRGGALYYWEWVDETSLSTRAVPVADQVGANAVPLMANYVMVADQARFVITLGSNDYASATQAPMLVRWSDQENYLEWEPRPTTQAGSFLLSAGSELMTAQQARQEILIWSDTALFSMQFIGPPLVFGFSTLADNTSIISPNAAIVVDNIAYWMGLDKFYIYTGRVETLPCTVRKYVFGDFNMSQKWQVTVGLVREFDEVWWFYPSKDSMFNDRYVVFNYAEGCWYYGKLDRTTWSDTGLKPNPIATKYDPATDYSRLLYHEVGTDDNTTAPATPIPAYIDTADFDIDDGYKFGFVTSILPDVSFAGSTANNPSVTMDLRARNFSGATYTPFEAGPVTRTSTVPVTQYTEQVFVRVRGRQMSFRISSTDRGVAWQLGSPRVRVREDGRK